MEEDNLTTETAETAETAESGSGSISELLEEIRSFHADFNVYVESAKETEEPETQQASGTVPDETLQGLRTDLQGFRESYEQTAGTMQETLDNVEYDSAMQFITLGVIVCMIAVIAGFFLARIVFRKL